MRTTPARATAQRSTGATRSGGAPTYVQAPTERYDLVRLRGAHPGLTQWIRRNPRGEETIDFSNPDAVRDLNQALLMADYGITSWDIPRDALCPGVPGRRDYLTTLAQLLAEDHGGVVPRGEQVVLFDLGVGANCIYPIIGRGEYGWRFIGSDIDPVAVSSAERIVQANRLLRGHVGIRRQPSASHIFADVLHASDRITAVICNPPFHASLVQAQSAARRKWTNLGHVARGARSLPTANFGGRAAELWCPGGEVGFLGRVISESAQRPEDAAWYTALVAQAAHLPAIERVLTRAQPTAMRVLAIARGVKQSRILAWSFLTPAARRARLTAAPARRG